VESGRCPIVWRGTSAYAAKWERGGNVKLPIKLLTLVAVASAIILFAESPQRQPAHPLRDAQVLTGNPTYSEAVLKGRLPENLLAEREAALAKADSEFARFLALPEAARAALESGKNDNAEEYANRALKMAPKYDRTHILENGHPMSNAGNVMFWSHIVLGRLALLHGDMDSAKEHLLLAGSTGGSPSLDIAGPNMSLARELLKRFEQQTVLKFLEECKRFWKEDRGQIDHWSAEIRSGAIPDFGANLFY
jgi:hypothetical protein